MNVQALLARPEIKRVIPVTIAFLLGAGLVSAFTIDDDTTQSQLTANASTTSTTAATADTTTPPLATTEPAAAATRVTTKPTTPPPAGGLAMPKPGDYAYRVDSKSDDDGDVSDDHYDAQLVIVDLGGGRQRHRFVELGSLTTVDDIAWRADGRYLVAKSDPEGSKNNTCDLEPDVKTFPNPATPGMTWTFRSSCSVKSPGESEPFTVLITGTAKIVGNERKTVGSTAVDTVHIHFEFGDDDPSDGPDATTTDEFYAPSLGLTIEETDHSNGSGKNDDGTTSTYDDLETRKLVSLQPN